MKGTKDQIWEAALKKIEIRPHSKAELTQKLSEKFPHERGTILDVIEEMERVHLISDRQFAEQYISHLTRKAIGRFKIMMECRRKGLTDNMCEQVLQEIDWSEDESIKRAIEEKSRSLSGLDERKKRQKLMNFLRNRGFSDRVIFQHL
jgi:regulatory protein